MHIRSAACVYIYTNRVHTFSVGVAHRNAGMDKILHRLEDMQSARRTQPAGRPERKPSANKSQTDKSQTAKSQTAKSQTTKSQTAKSQTAKSQTARPVERDRVPEAPVASEQLRGNKVEQDGGTVYDWAHPDTMVSILAGDGTKGCTFLYYLHKDGEEDKIPIEEIPEKELQIGTFGHFKACFTTMRKSTTADQMQALANLLKKQTVSTTKTMPLIYNVSIGQLDEMEIDAYLGHLDGISSIKAEHGKLEVYVGKGQDEEKLMSMDLEWFTSHFASIASIDSKLSGELTKKQYFDSWVGSEMVMKHHGFLNDWVYLFEYLAKLGVPMFIDSSLGVSCLYMDAKSAKGVDESPMRVLSLDTKHAYLLIDLFEFTASRSSDKLSAYWHLLKTSSRIGPLTMSQLYNMNEITLLTYCNVAVRFTSKLVANHISLHLDVVNEGNLIEYDKFVTLDIDMFSHIFKTIHNDLLSTIEPPAVVTALMAVLKSDATVYVHKHGTMLTGYDLDQLAHMNLVTYCDLIGAGRTAKRILEEQEKQAKLTREGTANGDHLANILATIPRDDTVSHPDHGNAEVSFKWHHDVANGTCIRVGVNESGRVTRFRVTNAEAFLKFFPSWTQANPIDLDDIKEHLGENVHYGAWSVEVLREINGFEDIVNRRARDAKSRQKDLDPKLMRVLESMNANPDLVAGHNIGRGELEIRKQSIIALTAGIEDTHPQGLELVVAPSTSPPNPIIAAYAHGPDDWVLNCPIHRQYRDSPVEAKKLYSRVLHSFFRAYVQRQADESIDQLGDKFNTLERNLQMHERAQQRNDPHRGSHTTHLSYAAFIAAIGHYAYQMNGTCEKYDRLDRHFWDPWRLGSMNELLHIVGSGYRFEQLQGGQYALMSG